LMRGMVVARAGQGRLAAPQCFGAPAGYRRLRVFDPFFYRVDLGWLAPARPKKRAGGKQKAGLARDWPAQSNQFKAVGCGRRIFGVFLGRRDDGGVIGSE